MLGKLVCWWFGCRPDAAYPSKCPDGYVVPCTRCGAEDIDYGILAGDTRHNRAVECLQHWLFRRWFPVRCNDCGRRYGPHDGCLPF